MSDAGCTLYSSHEEHETSTQLRFERHSCIHKLFYDVWAVRYFLADYVTSLHCQSSFYQNKPLVVIRFPPDLSLYSLCTHGIGSLSNLSEFWTAWGFQSQLSDEYWQMMNDISASAGHKIHISIYTDGQMGLIIQHPRYISLRMCQVLREIYRNQLDFPLGKFERYFECMIQCWHWGSNSNPITTSISKANIPWIPWSK